MCGIDMLGFIIFILFLSNMNNFSHKSSWRYNMLYELRIYYINSNKMPDIHKRFAENTLDLFKKHNIHVCDFYEDAEDGEKLYYICAFEDRNARDVAFDAFREDKDWQRVFEESRVNGAIVEKVESFFMNRVPYINVNWK